MTPKVTTIGQPPQTVEGLVNENRRITEVEFRTDDAQLLGLWTATRLLGEIREFEDLVDRNELLTKAQILLTAFVLGLVPLGSDQTKSGSARTGLGRMVEV